MKWNLRWVAARQDIWRPTQLLAAFQEVGFTPSLSKVSALWSNKPITIRLDDLDMICTALNCTVADLMEAEQVDVVKQDEGERKAVGETGAGPTSAVRPVPKANSKGLRRSLPPN